MTELGIACPLMIVKGDGTLALAETVAPRPIETVLSGPAASLVGARWLSGLDNFILSDMGGTTTDLGDPGEWPPVGRREGAEVGGWRTMVKAIDVTHHRAWRRQRGQLRHRRRADDRPGRASSRWR